MIRYRPFLNTDPPKIAEVWRSQADLNRLVQPMSPAILDRYVFSKPYFDRLGLVLAEEDGQPVGVAHGGFGPRDDHATLAHDTGIICLILVSPHRQRMEIAARLLTELERYLVQNGAGQLQAGESPGLCPFYLGLCGGSQQPGILAEDSLLLDLVHEAGYQPAERHLIMQRQLAGFRPLVDRQQMQLRRRYQIEAVLDPPSKDWWQACTHGHIDQCQFRLVPRGGGVSIAHSTFWDIEPLASSWGVHASGLLDLMVTDDAKWGELSVFLLGETMRQLQSQGATLLEAHCPESDTQRLETLTRIGFEKLTHGQVFRRAVAAEDASNVPTDRVRSSD